ncbi:MAG TPA: VanZ family protein [Enterococcus columbae]|nr:VanZ family protein [Enterococcus columbae]
MNKIFRYCLVGVISVLAAYVLIDQLAYPVLMKYHHLATAMSRFSYTKLFLEIYAAMSLFFLYVQLLRKKFSPIYLYLFYSVYLFLLFIVLFGKARNYHSLSLVPWDFLVWNRTTLTEAFLNVIYFIPLGVLFSFATKWWEFLVISFLVILGIETIQYVFSIGTFAVSDILLNLLGCCLGRLFFLFLPYWLEKKQKFVH